MHLGDGGSHCLAVIKKPYLGATPPQIPSPSAITNCAMASPASNASSDYGTALFDFGGFSKGSKNHDPLVLGEFKSLQRLNIVQIQNELAEIKGNIAAKKIVTVEQMKSTRRLLREYSEFSLLVVRENAPMLICSTAGSTSNTRLRLHGRSCHG